MRAGERGERKRKRKKEEEDEEESTTIGPRREFPLFI